jgi:superfamily II DNA or RNA helicase
VGIDESGLEAFIFRRSYSTSKDNLFEDFYVPALERSTRYDRAAGFFSSAILALAPLAFSSFIAGGGRMRLICSPNLTKSDVRNLVRDSDITLVSREQVITDLKSLAEGRDEQRILSTLLSSLIAADILDLRIAVPISSRGLFHDKVGIFSDSKRTVSFVGSANETMAAWSGFDNHEQIEVFASWHNEDSLARTKEHRLLFDELWNGVRRGWRILDHREGRDVVTSIIKPVEIDVALDEVKKQVSKSPKARNGISPRDLMPHQLAVIEDWERHNRQGLICFATGGGKTLAGIEGIRRWTKNGQPALVLVPSTILHKQWLKELNQELPEQQVIMLGAGFPLNNREGILRTALEVNQHGAGNIVLSTYSMAARDSFLELISDDAKTILCADEVHNIGATESQNIMRKKAFGGRIGLSATPTRKGSSDETNLINDYFGETLAPLFTIKDAIAAKRLVPYNYYYRTVKLIPQEQEDWYELTQKIKKIVAMNKGKFPTEKKEAAYFANLLIKRAAIVKGAFSKISLAKELLTEKFIDGDRWLVYCQDQQQMNAVKDNIKHLKFPILDYHQKMSGDASTTLSYFTREGGVMLAIKCLDEGVDIPEINKALILASSTNPREYIQRRGRVLRAHEGKFSADIYDVLVLNEEGGLLSEGEAERALEFAEEAQNSSTKLELKILLDKDKGVDYVSDDNSNAETGVSL